MNCKPGDMAIVTKGEFAGQIVEVLYLTIRFRNGEQVWQIKLQRPMLLYCWYGNACTRQVGQEAVCPDHGLRPVSGLPLAEDETHEEPTEERA